MTPREAFPSRAVRLIEPFGPGGGPDIIARVIAEALSAAWAQPVIVENHPGAGSTAAPERVARAGADGHTLLVNTSAHAYSAVFADRLPYDPLNDFVPVAALTSQPYVLVAAASAGIASIADLLAAARPGELCFASTGLGTGTHLAVEKLNRDAGITAIHVPPQPSEAVADVMRGVSTGRAAYALSPIAIAAPHLENGDLVALGVSTSRRSRLLPEVPTLAEAGVSGYEFPIWYGLWAPARTPEAIVGTLWRDIAAAMAAPEVQELLSRHDAEPMAMSHPEFAAFVARESEMAAGLLPGS